MQGVTGAPFITAYSARCADSSASSSNMAVDEGVFVKTMLWTKRIKGLVGSTVTIRGGRYRQRVRSQMV
jgi:hypothetical protein